MAASDGGAEITCGACPGSPETCRRRLEASLPRSAVPFGGRRKSGYGREKGREALDALCCYADGVDVERSIADYRGEVS